MWTNGKCSVVENKHLEPATVSAGCDMCSTGRQETGYTLFGQIWFTYFMADYIKHLQRYQLIHSPDFSHFKEEVCVENRR